MYKKTVWPSFNGKKESFENKSNGTIRIGYKGWIIRCFKTDTSFCTNGHTCDYGVKGSISDYCWVYTVSYIETLKTINTATTSSLRH